MRKNDVVVYRVILSVAMVILLVSTISGLLLVVKADNLGELPEF